MRRRTRTKIWRGGKLSSLDSCASIVTTAIDSPLKHGDCERWCSKNPATSESELLPGQLKEINLLSADLKQEIDGITEAISKFRLVAEPPLNESRRNLAVPGMSHEEMLQSCQYKEVVAAARRLSDAIRQWRTQTTNASAVMAEDLPHCRAALIHSKQYRIHVKKLRETFNYVGKALQFVRFLVLKVPEVRQLEEDEERQNRMLGLDHEGVDLKEAVSRVAGMAFVGR